jgi:hypothetical protein
VVRALARRLPRLGPPVGMSPDSATTLVAPSRVTLLMLVSACDESPDPHVRSADRFEGEASILVEAGLLGFCEVGTKLPGLLLVHSALLLLGPHLFCNTPYGKVNWCNTQDEKIFDP